MVFGFSAFSGMSWMTSQCSTIFPSLTMKMSTAACPRSFGLSFMWLWMKTRSPSAPICLISADDSGNSFRNPVMPSLKAFFPSAT